MASNKNISVKICGNPDSNSGFDNILIFNSPSFDVSDIVYGGFDNCSYFYTITTCDSQNIFKLIKNNVRSHGAIRPGNLVIAFSIPKNYKLDDGFTPYDVLEKLKDEFLKRCMTLKDAVRETYEFNSERIDQHILDDVAKEFTISPSPSPHRVMNPNATKGYIVKTDAEIEKLFHDINYPEFDNYSEVIVAESVSQTSYTLISNIQIPRIPNYAIYVDGKLQTTCNDLNQPLHFSSYENAEYFENKTFSFTIQDLKDGNLYTDIKINETEERIDISTKGWAIPKRRKIKLQIHPEELEPFFISNCNLFRIMKANNPIRLDSDMSFTLVGNDIADIENGRISIFVTENNKCKLSSSYFRGDNLIINLEKKIPSQPRTIPIKGKPQYKNESKDQEFITNSPVVNVQILITDFLRLTKNAKEIEMRLQTNSQNGKQTKCSQIVSFSSYEKSSPNIYKGHFYIPKEFFNSHITFSTHDVVWVSKMPIETSKDILTLKNEDFEGKKKSVYQKFKYKIVLLVFAFIALLFGILGYMLHDPIQSFTQPKLDNSDTSFCPLDTSYVEQDTITNEQAKKFLENAQSRLKKKDVTFAEIDEFYNDLQKHKDKYKELDKRDFKEKVCNQINDYYNICKYIKEGKVDDITDAMNKFSKGDFHIWNTHANVINKIIKDEDSTTLYMNKYSSLKSFSDIDLLYADSALSDDGNGDTEPTPKKLCNICNKQFNSNNELKKHKEKEHRFICKKCGSDKWFNTKEELDQHYKVHHEER